MIRHAVAFLLLAAVPALPALADSDKNKNKGHGKSKHHAEKKEHHDEYWNGRHDQRRDDERHYEDRRHDDDGYGDRGADRWRGEAPRFSSSDREYWQGYWASQYRHGKCPPGLSRRHNGCRPPGQVRYQVGQQLPPGVMIQQIPRGVLPGLTPLPPGYQYGMIDGDLVKYSIGRNLVVDAVNSFLY